MAAMEGSSEPTKTSPKTPSSKNMREGKVQIQGYFPKERRRLLKALAAETDKTNEQLPNEASDLLFANMASRHDGMMDYQ